MTAERTVLTGATGFLGSRLCAELLRRTDRELVCVVRASTARDATARVRTRLWHQDVDVAESPRLHAVPGDLTRPDLGLAEQVRGVVDVYHCAASVNMGATYEELAPVNVAGTRNVVRFARTAGARRLHHVSTLGVFLNGTAANLRNADETTRPTAMTAGPIGYPRSKYDAEQTTTDAGDVAVTVYRPGLVLADSRDGACPDDDFIARLYGATTLTGCYPTSLSDIPVVTADHAAVQIAALSLTEPAAGQAFHIMDPTALPAMELFTQAIRHGHHLREVTADEWTATLREHSPDRRALAMRRLKIAVNILGLNQESVLPQVNCSVTANAAPTVPTPDLDRPYFTRLLNSLAHRGTIPQPTGGRR